MDENTDGHPARYALLRALWRDAIDGWSAPGALEQLPAARRLLAAGADREDLARLARAVAYEAVFMATETLDHGQDAAAPGAGWTLLETGGDGEPTGRPLDGLHEDLLALDPSGHDGADLWA
ncbi:hypothetical protein [Kitasatospora sp. NPDC057198]|uniref:hypothetical protein n=1 Tax=Kitasatospora sp. NPDC057198 TaxID=3346046 RepID=UPI00363AEC95